jgi:N-acetyltransferase
MELQPRLAGELLELRPLREEDFDDLWAAGSDPLVWEQHPAKDRSTPDGFRAYFDDHLASGGALAVVDRGTGRVIGVSRYAFYEPERREVEIGWTFLARSQWGGTVNGELKRLMLEHAFQYVDTVVFLIDANNTRSQRAVEKLGAARTGEVRRELVVYAIKP